MASPSPSLSTSPTNRTVRYVRPPLYERQLEFLDCPARYTVVEASTKTGKTVACIVWLLEEALRGRPGYNYWWIAPIFPQAKIAFRRLRRYLPRSLFTENQSELTITLANGAMIWFKGADNPDSLYGEDVHAAVVDEATRCKEDAWIALRSTLTATRGPVKIIGNVKGRKNWAYTMARLAESGEPGYAHFKLTAYDAAEGLADLKRRHKIPSEAKVITLEEIEDAKRSLPEAAFRELYLAEPSDDGGNPFGLDAIRRCVAEMSDKSPSVWGWDLAKSVDWTVGVALDGENLTCAFERWRGPWNDTMESILRLNRQTPALVDSTGVGDPVLEQLQRRSWGTFEGFKFTSQSKQQLMEGLAVAIQEQSIAFPDGPLVSELETFEYEYTRTGVRYSAPPGLHDDCVMALALAVRHASTYRQSFAYVV